MAITPDRVREIFQGLERGDRAAFFDHVADNVDWTVMGTHPLAGRYIGKEAFIAGTFAKLGQVLPEGAQLHMEHLIVQDDQAQWSSFILWPLPGTVCASTTAIVGLSISGMV